MPKIKPVGSHLYVGIDPGLYGAIAIINAHGAVLGLVDTPTTVVKKGKTKRNVYLPNNMADVLQELPYSRIQVIALELVHAMPKQGVHSMFQMGRGVGTWEGIIAALSMPLEYVTPQAWKKEMIGQKSGDNKGLSILKASQLFPGTARRYLTRKKDDGRAEALLIAEYIRRKNERN